MTLKTEGDRHVVLSRRFAAPPETVYRAHTDPSLIQKWLLGPDGWTMPVCINEARAAMLATGMEHGMDASYVRLETTV